MWDNPRALDAVSTVLLVLTVLFAAVMAVRQAAVIGWPIAAIEVRGAGHPDTRAGLAPALAGLSGGLFSVDLEAARRGLEGLPWVRGAMVRRVWPDTLVIELEEHVPSADWNGLAMLNSHGEAFPVKPLPGLPRLVGPEGMEKEVASHYAEFTRVLAGHELEIATLRVDQRRAWQITLSDGVTVDLGRDRLADRLRRLVTYYPMVAIRMNALRRIDMRYPNGFAVRGELTQRDEQDA